MHKKKSGFTKKVPTDKPTTVVKTGYFEDNGEDDKGKPKDVIDKMYYFNNNKLIKELSKKQEKEYTIKESDAEERLSEFNEYIEIYKSVKK